MEQRDRLCFMHVPKCGGSALRQALGSLYPSNDIVHFNQVSAVRVAEAVGADQNACFMTVLGYLFCAKPALLMGHFGYPARLRETIASKYAFITLLRDPVARFLSHFYYNRDRNYNDDYSLSEDLTVESFIANETSRARGWGSMYVNYFLGMPQGRDGKGFSTAATEVETSNAVQNAKDFSLVGYLEDLKDFKTQTAAVLGQAIELPLVNQSPSRNRHKELSPSTLRLIEDICLPDLEVYHSVK